MPERVDAVAVDVGDRCRSRPSRGRRRRATRRSRRPRAAGRSRACADPPPTPPVMIGREAGVAERHRRSDRRLRARSRPSPAAWRSAAASRRAARRRRRAGRWPGRRPAAARTARAARKPRVSAAEQPLARDRQLEPRLRPERVRARHRGGVLHLRDRRDAGDRLLWRTRRSSRTPRRSAGRRCRPGCRSCPAATPVSASGPPSSRARIRSRCGPCTLRSTPRMWTLKSCSSAPWKTVRPTPTMPGRISSTGIRRGRGRKRQSR